MTEPLATFALDGEDLPFNAGQTILQAATRGGRPSFALSGSGMPCCMIQMSVPSGRVSIRSQCNSGRPLRRICATASVSGSYVASSGPLGFQGSCV